jgi:hypothetical protein
VGDRNFSVRKAQREDCGTILARGYVTECWVSGGFGLMVKDGCSPYKIRNDN